MIILYRKLKLKLTRRLIGTFGIRWVIPSPFNRPAQHGEDLLVKALAGGMAFQTLRTSHRIGLFHHLKSHPGSTLADLSCALKMKTYPIQLLVIALASLGIVVKIGDHYYNNPLHEVVLCGDLIGDNGIGKIMEFFQHIVNPAFNHLEEAVRENKPAGLQALYGADAPNFYECLANDPARNRIFADAMQADTCFNRDAFASMKVFASVDRVLDVGGNIGEMAIAIARRHPGVKIDLFDFPEVLKKATARFLTEGLSDRLGVVGGDFADEGFPPNYDCILFSHFLDIFSAQKFEKFARRAYEALPPGGKVCILGSIVRDDETGPVAHALISLYFLCLANGEGRFYTPKFTKSVLKKVGFKHIKCIEFPRNEMGFIATK